MATRNFNGTPENLDTLTQDLSLGHERTNESLQVVQVAPVGGILDVPGAAKKSS